MQEEGVTTVSGWVTHRLGGFPKAGDVLPVGGYALRVEEMEGMRVAKLRLTFVAPTITLFEKPQSTPLYPGNEVITRAGVSPGADGNIWFTRLDPNRGEYMSELGRITPSGKFLRPYAIGHNNVDWAWRSPAGELENPEARLQKQRSCRLTARSTRTA